MATDQVGQRRRAALVRNMGDVDAGFGREIDRAEMNAAADAGGRIIDPSGLVFGERDQSLTECAGSVGFTSITSALLAMRPIGAKSLRGS